MQTIDRSSTAGFRPDVEGLRGIAVLLVLLFHAGLAGATGGFVGVDVFFVISGFLITGLLLRERERTGRISFRRFYARRVRRLLPAAAVVLVVTLPIAYLLTGPLDRGRLTLDAAAAALSVGNLRFAAAQGDYFAALTAPSPFLHYWSLSVEEQFYLVWPVLLLLVARGRRPRLTAGLALVLLAAASLFASATVTAQSPTWAFYLLPTRAWQLAVGGILAVAAGPIAAAARRTLTAAGLAVVGWLGLAAIAVAAVRLDAGVPYPGLIALVPTLGTAAVILAHDHPAGPAALLRVGPVRWLGRISYSLYLWHWPILVLPAMAIGELGLLLRLGLLGAAIGAGWLSCVLIEEPFRRGLPRLTERPGLTIALGASAIVVVVGLASGLAAANTRQLDALTAEASRTMGPASAAPDPSGAVPASSIPEAGLGSTGWDASGTRPTPSVPGDPVSGMAASPGPVGDPALPRGAPPGSSGATAAPDPSATVIPSPAPAVVDRGPGLPADVRPPLLQARDDAERLRADGCLAYEAQRVPRDCVYGDPSGTFTVALVGDSHASDLFPAVEAIALERGWRLVTYVKVACPFADVAVFDQVLGREYTECADFRAATIERLTADPPDLVIVGMSHWLQTIHPADSTVAAQSAAIARDLERLPGRVAIVVDRPRSGQDVPGCLAGHLDDIGACAVPKAVAFAGDPGLRERAAATLAGAGVIDLTRDVCPGTPCPVVVHDMIVFRDNHHFTATFARSLAPAMAAQLDATLRP